MNKTTLRRKSLFHPTACSSSSWRWELMPEAMEECSLLTSSVLLNLFIIVILYAAPQPPDECAQHGVIYIIWATLQSYTTEETNIPNKGGKRLKLARWLSRTGICYTSLARSEFDTLHSHIKVENNSIKLSSDLHMCTRKIIHTYTNTHTHHTYTHPSRTHTCKYILIHIHT